MCVRVIVNYITGTVRIFKSYISELTHETHNRVLESDIWDEKELEVGKGKLSLFFYYASRAIIMGNFLNHGSGLNLKDVKEVKQCFPIPVSRIQWNWLHCFS